MVVHEQYRNKEIAKNLLCSIWGFTDHYAWGIVSASPYAVRALEKTTRRRSEPARIKHNLKKILSLGIENVPYITKDTKVFVNKEVSKINTEFYVDHEDIEKMINDVVTDTVPWTLGDLDEGWEWLAFTFQDQLPFELSNNEIDNMLKMSDQFVKNAYSRMDFSANHKWMSNTTDETNFMIRELEMKNTDTLIDFGCGQGRHSIGIAQMGYNVIGIDYIENNIKIAQKEQEKNNLTNIKFLLKDCRDINLGKKANAAICMYDVIGSYADNNENMKILESISNNLEVGSKVLISVMNYELTLDIAKNKFVLSQSAKELMSLRPSNIMETSGNIFDPDFYLVDTETGVIYRREQFKRGNAMPIELIVRDKRFSLSEIQLMCESVGFEVIFARFVNSKDWETELKPTDRSAKEILLKCVKSK